MEILAVLWLLYTLAAFVFLAFIAGAIASSRRRSWFGWFLAGICFGPFALAVYLLPPRPHQAEQPDTAEAAGMEARFEPPKTSNLDTPWAKYSR